MTSKCIILLEKILHITKKIIQNSVQYLCVQLNPLGNEGDIRNKKRKSERFPRMYAKVKGKSVTIKKLFETNCLKNDKLESIQLDSFRKITLETSIKIQNVNETRIISFDPCYNNNSVFLDSSN